jgi:uncharacterized protein (DUF433 family)
MSTNLLSRITHNPDICHRKPCIRGLRYPIDTILELLSSDMTHTEILEDYKDLEPEDIYAVLLFNVNTVRLRLSKNSLNGLGEWSRIQTL